MIWGGFVAIATFFPSETCFTLKVALVRPCHVTFVKFFALKPEKRAKNPRKMMKKWLF